MNRQNELLKNAIEAMRAAEPDSDALAASAGRIADCLGVAMPADAAVEQIRSCEDVRHLLDAYRKGTLSEPRSLLVKAHLSDCGTCLRYFREGSKAAVVEWFPPATRSTAARPSRRPHALGWALAFSFGLAVVATFFYKAYWEVPPGVRAEVQSIDGSAYLIPDG